MGSNPTISNKKVKGSISQLAEYMPCMHKVIGSNPIISISVMSILILLLPFFAFLSGSLFGRFLGIGVAYITTFFTFLSCLLSINVLFNIIETGNCYIISLFE